MKKAFFPRLTAVLLAACLLLTACGQSAQAAWQEQYDLGMTYLSEGNYAEAILAFTAAIEIDPRQPASYAGRGQAYVFSGETEENLGAAQADFETALDLDETFVDAWLGLADVYIRRGDYDRAMALLQEALEKTGNDQSIADKIAEMEAGQITDSAGNVRQERIYDKTGELTATCDYRYDARGYKTGWTNTHYEDGAVTGSNYAVVEFGEDGYPSKNVYYNGDGSLMGSYDIMTFNELGQEVQRQRFLADGGYMMFEHTYDESGRLLRYDAYNEDGTLFSYWVCLYDEAGTCTGTVRYDAEGNVTATSTYS